MQCFHKIVYLDSILIKILVKAVNPVSFVKNGLIKDTQVQLVRMVENVVVAQRTVKIGKLANVLEHSELGKSQRIPAYAKVVIYPQFTRLNRKLLQIISTASPN